MKYLKIISKRGLSGGWNSNITDKFFQNRLTLWYVSPGAFIYAHICIWVHHWSVGSTLLPNSYFSIGPHQLNCLDALIINRIHKVIWITDSNVFSYYISITLVSRDRKYIFCIPVILYSWIMYLRFFMKLSYLAIVK